jgi:uncharacterized protein (DUF1501 family)
MPNLNRRRFLQMTGAAGLAPALPAMPAAAVASGPATHAQLLWASLHARAGSAAGFADVTRLMGLSSQAAQGVYANVARLNVVTAHAATRLNRVSAPRPMARKTSAPSPKHRGLEQRVRRFVGETYDTPASQADIEEPMNTKDQDAQ